MAGAWRSGESSLASQTQPTPARIAFPIRDTASDPRWGWLGLACETMERGGPQSFCIILQNKKAILAPPTTAHV